jgi:hypothetical protein
MQWNDGDGGVDLTGAPWHPGDGGVDLTGAPWQLRWGPALRVGGEGCTATGTEGLDGFGHIAHREADPRRREHGAVMLRWTRCGAVGSGYSSEARWSSRA